MYPQVKGRWNHLGEATLMNRIKSHPDVGEAWYPDLLEKIRAQQVAEGAAKTRVEGDATSVRELAQPTERSQIAVEAH